MVEKEILIPQLNMAKIDRYKRKTEMAEQIVQEHKNAVNGTQKPGHRLN